MCKKVVCFGEMLWDCYPDQEIPGGAPMNVALHLQQLGLEAKLISRIGKDTKGEKIIAFVKSFGLTTEHIQEDGEHPTGTITIDDRDKENINYEITSPVAWDFIERKDADKIAVDDADAFVFGSLSIRNNTSWTTLVRLMRTSTLKIFDINLRPPYFDFEKIELLLGFTDILKINEHELEKVAHHFGISADETEFCLLISKYFPIKMICITLGDKGALLYQEGRIRKHPGYNVKVEDTLGSGDAFLSGLIKSYLDGNSPEEMLDLACKLGAFIATKKGGTPKYLIGDLMDNVS